MAVKFDRKYTYADYKKWEDDERWELIYGEAYNMSPAPTRTHQIISGNLFRKIGNYLEDKKCQVYAAPFDVRFVDRANQSDEDIETVVQPDIVVICDENKLDDAGCKGSPDIVIEILSLSTYKKDKFEKFYLYEKYGVKEYWIVYPGEKIVEIYKLTDGRYGEPDVYGIGDNITVGLFPNLNIDCNDVFK
ncbi:MAG TPA: Uma2 family endonuclease [Spirochaetota bacterium]|nr:Uma2 family endonuclease [Spirochaetota bacterium]